MFKERIYKIWKQFTTGFFRAFSCALLCSKNEYTKSESNSQPDAYVKFVATDCVQRTNIQNLKAIHNSLKCIRMRLTIVFKERIYKIWKQFTTVPEFLMTKDLLCSKNEYTKSESNSQLRLLCCLLFSDCVQRTNIQNLKAIHNSQVHSSS